MKDIEKLLQGITHQDIENIVRQECAAIGVDPNSGSIDLKLRKAVDIINYHKSIIRQLLADKTQLEKEKQQLIDGLERIQKAGSYEYEGVIEDRVLLNTQADIARQTLESIKPTTQGGEKDMRKLPVSDWLNEQFEQARKDIARYPKWMQEDCEKYDLTGSEQTKEEGS